MRVLNTQEVKQVSGGTFGLIRWIFGGCFGGGHGHGGHKGGHGHGGHKGGHKGGRC